MNPSAGPPRDVIAAAFASGEYVRRYVPELAGMDGAAVHDPDPDTRRRCGYPMPIVSHREAIASYRARIRG